MATDSGMRTQVAITEPSTKTIGAPVLSWSRSFACQQGNGRYLLAKLLISISVNIWGVGRVWPNQLRHRSCFVAFLYRGLHSGPPRARRCGWPLTSRMHRCFKMSDPFSIKQTFCRFLCSIKGSSKTPKSFGILQSLSARKKEIKVSVVWLFAYNITIELSSSPFLGVLSLLLEAIGLMSVRNIPWALEALPRRLSVSLIRH